MGQGDNESDDDEDEADVPFLGEFDSDHDVNGKPWSRDLLGGKDTTLNRLELLESEGCELALIWPDLPTAADKDPIRLQADTRSAIVEYTSNQ